VIFQSAKTKKAPSVDERSFLQTEPVANNATEDILCSHNTNKLTAFWTFYFKHDFAISGCEQGMVFATTHIYARMKTSATLTDDDITRYDAFTTKTLYT
jgi:hypothetical protein